MRTSLSLTLSITSQGHQHWIPVKLGGGLIACLHLDAPGTLFTGSESPWEPIRVDLDQYRSFYSRARRENPALLPPVDVGVTQNSRKHDFFFVVNTSPFSHVGAHRDFQTPRARPHLFRLVQALFPKVLERAAGNRLYGSYCVK